MNLANLAKDRAKAIRQAERQCKLLIAAEGAITSRFEKRRKAVGTPGHRILELREMAAHLAANEAFECLALALAKMSILGLHGQANAIQRRIVVDARRAKDKARQTRR